MADTDPSFLAQCFMQNEKKNLHENIEDLSGVGEETIELTQVGGGGDMLQCIKR